LAAKYGFEGFVGVPLCDSHERPLGLIAAYFRETVKDVSLAESLLAIFATRTAAEINRMRADEERAMLQAEAMRMQHLSSLGVLAGGIAHDFNNILSAIIGYTELAAGRLPADGREHAQLQQALAAAFRAGDLVQQILAFSRQAKSDRKVIDLCNVVREAMRFLRASTPATVDVHTSVPAAAAPVMGDATQLHQVVMNLCTNAVQAIGQGPGELALSLTVETVGRDLATRLGGAEGLYAHMSIRDNGCGMDQATLARIFEPFYTTKDPGGGTGLGLATAHGVVTDHGGAITVESEVGAGSVFHVYLPCCGDKGAERAIAEAEIPTGTERILFVDDEPFLAEMAAQVLQSLGYAVVTKTDSMEAWETFEQDPDEVDLLVTDQTMPQLTGLDLIERVRRLRPGLPVIIMTGYHQRLLDARPSELGVWEIVSKPYSIRALGQAIRGALDSVKG
jgi:signal transduction histidine kinase/ActR/RegA family two-component response regulator